MRSFGILGSANLLEEVLRVFTEKAILLIKKIIHFFLLKQHVAEMKKKRIKQK